jgi:hypothetical protein
MARAPCTFRQRDVTRALRAAKAAGEPVRHYEIAVDGTIRVFIGEPGTARDEYVLSDWEDAT